MSNPYRGSQALDDDHRQGSYQALNPDCRNFSGTVPRGSIGAAVVFARSMTKQPPAERPRAQSAARTSAALSRLRADAINCHDCDLWRHATQTVFGEGPARAQLVLIGEQPGDAEDRSGHPFVGPAGRLLDRALVDAGIDRADVYLTNTVKHFKFKLRGKRRLHQRANAQEQAACRHWLDAELAELRPGIVVCLGAMAAKAIFGPAFGLMQRRGQWIKLGGDRIGIATVHPSYLLRVPDADREQAYREFVADLRKIRRRVAAE